jgi:hypothetical protein
VGWVKGEQTGSVYKQPESGEDNPDTAGGCQVSRRGYKGGAKGNQQGGKKQGELCHVYV